MSLLAITVLAGLVAAGCAAPGPTHTSGGASPTPAATPTAATQARNKLASQREANRLVTLARVPAGAVELAAKPPALNESPLNNVPDSAVSSARYWRVDLAYPDAVAWVKAHPPTGLTYFSSFTMGGEPNPSSGFGYSAADSEAWTNASLQMEIAPLSPNTSTIAAIGEATWLDPVPRRDDRAGPRMNLTVSGGCPASDEGIVGVASSHPDLTLRLVPDGDPTGGVVCRYDGMNGRPYALVKRATVDSATATRIAQALRQIKLSHPTGNLARPCPFDDGRAVIIALSYQGQPDVAVWFAPGGCTWISNGTIGSWAGGFGQAIDAITPPD